MHAGVSQRRDIDSIRPDFQRAILRTNTTGAVDRDPLCETLGWGSLPESDAPFLPYPQHVRNASNGAHQHLANSHLFGLTIRSPHFTSSRPFYEILTVPSNCNQVAARQFGYSRITHTPCRLAYSVRPRTGSTPCPRRFGWQPRLTSSPYINGHYTRLRRWFSGPVLSDYLLSRASILSIRMELGQACRSNTGLLRIGAVTSPFTRHSPSLVSTTVKSISKNWWRESACNRFLRTWVRGQQSLLILELGLVMFLSLGSPRIQSMLFFKCAFSTPVP
ncbi:hypothetical protein CC77DRAFT_235588 [Alternaria alternata]|uniref:Uncharacterized protein n=1 Tax=Alternaria alternata TaxID=5599 RepID=A0A177DF58_ALTAL|nr:hypothetical protein CC77DRAFT_235588 [Alternaria alternata]OAG17780.1 hypothetical protein CC77DRAFT_235588 [Alternaria alternata]